MRPTRLGNEPSHLRRSLRDRRSFLKPETRFLARSRDETFLRTQARSTHGTVYTLVARLHSSPPFLMCNLDRQEATSVQTHSDLLRHKKRNKTKQTSPLALLLRYLQKNNSLAYKTHGVHTHQNTFAALLTSKHPLNLSPTNLLTSSLSHKLHNRNLTLPKPEALKLKPDDEKTSLLFSSPLLSPPLTYSLLVMRSVRALILPLIVLKTRPTTSTYICPPLR